MMMSQNYAPYIAGYPTIDAVRTDLNRLFYADIRPEAVSNLPISPVWNAMAGYQQTFAGQPGYAGHPAFAGQPTYVGQPAYAGQPGYVGQGYFPPAISGYQPWQTYNWQPNGSWQHETSWADPRYADPRYVESRYIDPRYVDPRYAIDPRFAADPRHFDPRVVDPRWGYQQSPAHLYSSLAPAVNVAETPDAHLLVVELPGVDVRDVSLQVAGCQLILTAFRKPIWNNGTITLGYQATEGRFGTLRRVFQVSAGYPTSQIQASFVNGQLTIVLPKAGVPMGTAMPTANIAINAAIPTGV